MGCKSCSQRKKGVKPVRAPRPEGIDNSAASQERALFITEPKEGDETFDKQEPLIKNWKTRPPLGGWGVAVRINGRTRRFGGTPGAIVSRILSAHKKNNLPMTRQKVWDALNGVWMERDPKRAISAQGHPIRTKPKQSPDSHVYTSPKDYGERVWGMLSMFGVKGAFNKDQWDATIKYVTDLLNPQESWTTGCEECYEIWAKIRMEANPDIVTNEHEAAEWVFNAHNKVNAKTGKPIKRFVNAIIENNWAFRVEGNKATPE